MTDGMQIDIFGGEVPFESKPSRPEVKAAAPRDEQLALIEATPARVRGRKVERVLFTEPELFGGEL